MVGAVAVFKIGKGRAGWQCMCGSNNQVNGQVGINNWVKVE